MEECSDVRNKYKRNSISLSFIKTKKVNQELQACSVIEFTLTSHILLDLVNVISSMSVSLIIFFLLFSVKRFLKGCGPRYLQYSHHLFVSYKV